MGWKDLLFKADPGGGVTDKKSAAPLPVRQHRSPQAAAAPIVVSDILSLGVSTASSALPLAAASTGAATPGVASGPSERALALVQKALAAVPADNPTVQLAATMRSMEEIIPDVGTRRRAALAALTGQGITEEKVVSGAAAAKEAVKTALDDAAGQIEQVRSGSLAAKRTEAASLRSQRDAVDRQIADLTNERNTLDEQAIDKDAEAADLELQLGSLQNDIDTARNIANGSFDN